MRARDQSSSHPRQDVSRPLAEIRPLEEGLRYLERWATDIIGGPSGQLTRTVLVEGVREAHLGPMLQVARITLQVEPATEFEVVLEPSLLVVHSGDEGLFEWAIFGFLDVVMLAGPPPLRNLRVTVVGAGVDPIHSSQMAFRFAGRDAGRKFLVARQAP